MIDLTPILNKIVATSAKIALAQQPGLLQEADFELDAHLLRLAEELGKLPHNQLEKLAEGDFSVISVKKLYRCPVCKSADPFAYLNCQYAGCPDGRRLSA